MNMLKKNTKSGSKSNSFKGNAHISLKQLLVFGLVFAAIGGFFLWRSFAATYTLATIGANGLKYSGGYSSLVADSSANSGYKLAMFSNGTATGSASTSSAITSVSVRAKGDQCNGAPSMNLAVDGVSLNTWNVNATEWTDYNTDITVKLSPSGAHTITISFANDYYLPGTCDRNLVLDSVILFGTNTATTTPTKVGYYNYLSQNNSATVFQSLDAVSGLGQQYVSDVSPGAELSYVGFPGKASISSVCYDARAYNSPKALAQPPSAYVTFGGVGNSISVDLPTDGNYYQICVPNGSKATPSFNVANLSSSSYILVYQAVVKY
jgi:hypothetical protein